MVGSLADYRYPSRSYDAEKEKRGWLLWLAGGEKGGRE